MKKTQTISLACSFHLTTFYLYFGVIVKYSLF